jgi:hypothetical protein
MDLNNKENGDVAQSRDPIRYIDAVKADGTQADRDPTVVAKLGRRDTLSGTDALVAALSGTAEIDGEVVDTGGSTSYSSFSEVPSLQAKIFLKTSTDCGQTWARRCSSRPRRSRSIKGAAVAVDPPTGNVYVAWRQLPSARRVTQGINPTRSTSQGDPGGAAVASVQTVLSLRPSIPQIRRPSPSSTRARRPAPSGPMPIRQSPWTARAGHTSWAQAAPTLGDARIDTRPRPTRVLVRSAFIDNGPLIDEALPTSNTYTQGHQFMPQVIVNAGRLTAIYYDVHLDHTLGLFKPVPDSPSPDAQGRFELETRSVHDRADGPCFGEDQTAGGSPVFTPFLSDTAHLSIRR